jgi:hypothetical protein
MDKNWRKSSRPFSAFNIASATSPKRFQVGATRLIVLSEADYKPNNAENNKNIDNHPNFRTVCSAELTKRKGRYMPGMRPPVGPKANKSSDQKIGGGTVTA